MSENFLYLVQGSTGEYSDHTEWNVAAYTDPEQAERHRDLAQKWSKCDPDEETRLSWDERDEITKNAPYDPNLYITYTGVRYYVDKVPLVSSPEEFVEIQKKPQEVTP